MKLIYLILIISVSSFAATKKSLSSDEVKNFKRDFLDFFNDKYITNEAYLPNSDNETKEHLFGSGEDLYLDGYVSLAGYKNIECKVQELFNIEKIIKTSNIRPGKECYFNTFSSKGCKKNASLSYYKNASNSNCDSSGLMTWNPLDGPLNDSNSIETTSGNRRPLKKRYKLWRDTIYKNFLSFILKETTNNPGYLKKVKENATVSACENGLEKSSDLRNWPSSNQCKKEELKCDGHVDCCSGLCIKDSPMQPTGICSARLTCFKPIVLNKQCGDINNDGYDNQFCTSGACMVIDYNSSDTGALKAVGKSCSSSTECRSDLCSGGKCKNQSKCLSCSKSGEEPTNSKMCCPGLIKSLKGRCIPDFPTLILPVVKRSLKIINTILNNLSLIAYAESMAPKPKCSGQEGNNLSPQDEAIYQSKLSVCNKKPQMFRSSCLSVVSKWRAKKLIEALGGEKCQWTAQDYKDQYNSIAVTSKTYSDVKKCEFNSFNDTWRDMSNIQRNAELVVRGFEYVYTGKGTEDYWVNSAGKNIYTRAKEIAQVLRTNRSNFLRKMKETDVTMACQCLAIFGPEKFSAAKQEFFNSESCSSERSSMASAGIGNTDPTSESVDQQDPDAIVEASPAEGEVAEVDTGASGISHEAILIKWLKIKYENQMDRFVANSEVEAQIEELSDYLLNQSWAKSKTKDEKLYEYKAYKGRWSKRDVWFKDQTSAFIRLISELGRGDGVKLGMFLGIWGTPNFSNKTLNGQVYDKHLTGWDRRGRIFRRYKDVSRRYVYPYYVNNDANNGGIQVSTRTTDLTCAIYGQSSSCFKNVFKTEFDGEDRFLIDIKSPLFVDYKAQDLKMGYVDKVNAGFKRGWQALKNTNPGRQRRVSWTRYYPLSSSRILKTMLPDGGNFKPRDFSVGTSGPNARKKLFLDGALKYAKCKDLVECGASDDYVDQFGFGELFESDDEAALFAEYTYQHHFHWPSLTASNFMGYPLMAQRAYFEVIAFNIKLVGSLAAGQGAGYGDAYFNYSADWDKRVGLYDSAGIVKLGDATKNVKYSKKFLSEFKTFDFSVGSGSKAFDANAANASAGSGFSGLENAALSAASSKDQSAFNQNKKRENYLAQTKSDPRADLKQEAQAKLLNSLGTPLNSMSLTVGGKNLGNTGGLFESGGSLKNVNKVLAKAEKKKYQETYPKETPQISSTPQPSFDMGAFGSGTEASSADKNIKASGMSQEDIDRMLNATKKNSSLKSDEDDGLFTAVSKAYKRNYDFFFERKSIKKANIEEKVEDLDDSKKDSLKKLLDN